LTDSARKFDPARADEYEQQSRIALAGYEACHELSACMLAATLGRGTVARVLVVGAGGTAQEIVTAGKLEPGWQFMAVDPSQPMLDLAVTKLRELDLADRTQVHLGYVDNLPPEERFDAATLIGVLHHLPGDDAKQAVLRSIATRLKPGAPFVLAGNHYAYTSQPLLLAAWGERWRMNGAAPDEIESKLAKILQGADPPHSEEAVASLLADAGFDKPLRFFSSLFWGAWLSRRTAA
jgi:tRNA (cmo5U34)-methyltransferase